jgi:toxin ParE1/3/4
MEVHLTPDQEAFVRQAIESGRLHRPEDAVEEALRLWEERERKPAEILASVDLAEASLARGEGRVIATEQDVRKLASEVNLRGRARRGAASAATLMAVRVATEVEADLDEIWSYVATESGDPDVAERLINSITSHFSMLSKHPQLGRRRDHDLRPGLRSLSVGAYVILHRIEGRDVIILHVLHGRRDLKTLLRQ